MNDKWCERLRVMPEMSLEIQQFVSEELIRCTSGKLRPQAFWDGMYLFALGMKVLRDQELEFVKLICCECTDPEITPPECRVTKVPTSCASDVYLTGRCILATLTKSKPWKSVSRDVARVLVVVGRLPPKPEHP